MIVDFYLSDDKKNIMARPKDFALSQVKSLLGYIKTINGQIINEEIIIPIGNKGIVDLYSKLEKIFAKKLNIQLSFSDEVDFLLSDGRNEAQNFADFSNKARLIRNNQINPAELQLFCDKLTRNDFVRTLKSHQLLSAYHLAFSQNACNFSVPGAGKTSTVLAAFHYLKNCTADNKHVDALVVVGPLAAFLAWKSDFKECFGHEPSYIALGGGDKSYNDRSFRVSKINVDLILISYGSVPGHLDDVKMLLNNNRCMLVLDEAHRIKNVEHGEGSWSDSIMQLAPLAKSRVVLTGTPAPNSYVDIYNLFNFIWPSKNIIGFSISQLNNMSGNRHDARVDDLINNISPFFIRIKKSDLHLPSPRFYKPISVEMSPIQNQIYEELLKTAVNRLDGNEQTIFSRRSIAIRLRQAASNPALLAKPIRENLDLEYADNSNYDDDLEIKDTILTIIDKYSITEIPNKFIAAFELVKRIIVSNEKIIVWCEFIDTCDRLSRYFADNGIANKILYGKTPQEEREKIVTTFKNPDNFDYQVVIANPHAVGESISLHTACHNALYYEQGFNAGVYMQSKDRIHRVGLSPDDIINYYYLQSAGTVEEVVYSRVMEKEQRMLDIIEKEEIPLISLNEDYEQDFEDDIKAIIRAYYERRKKVFSVT